MPVGEDASHMLLTAHVDYPYKAYVERVWDPEGAVVFDAEDYWDRPYGATGAINPKEAASLNWPFLPDQAELVPGDYEVLVGVIDEDSVYVRRAPVVVDAVFKDDGDVGAGVLRANLVLAGDDASDEHVRGAAEGAVEHWRSLYAQMGIDVRVEWGTWDEEVLRAPGNGTREEWIAIGEQHPLGTVSVVLVPEIEDSPGLYGVAGGIPGPLVPTGQTGIVLSSLVNAGPDGVYSADEVRLLGETMAHETGHYLGLFHPVEVEWGAWDVLSDTPECSTQIACIDRLGENLMFPFPICGSGGCQPQFELTDEQAGVANRYTGVE